MSKTYQLHDTHPIFAKHTPTYICDTHAAKSAHTTVLQPRDRTRECEGTGTRIYFGPFRFSFLAATARHTAIAFLIIGNILFIRDKGINHFWI